MSTNKKAYIAPKFVIHGSIGSMTQQSGGTRIIDVPMGTPVGLNGLIDIASS